MSECHAHCECHAMQTAIPQSGLFVNKNSKNKHFIGKNFCSVELFMLQSNFPLIIATKKAQINKIKWKPSPFSETAIDKVPFL